MTPLARTLERGEAPGFVSARSTLPIIEGYRVLRELGRGGMGAVYLADDLKLHRRVAIKLISTGLAEDDDARARFLREARAMATVEHPHLVRIYSYGEGERDVYLVMEYIEGESLADRIRRLGRLSVEEALLITAQIAKGLEAAWKKGIVHRDIKPANVLIDTHDRVHLADFGLAKLVRADSDESALTRASHIVGTPLYLSPEQARGEEVDHRTDMYSLGILLYELLVGAPPFRDNSPAQIIAHHLQTPLPRLHDKRPQISPDVARLIEQMTDKDPDGRPESYAVLRNAIEATMTPPLRWTAGSPYRGLAAFGFEHAPVFFGRSRAVEDVLNAARTQAEHGRAFVLVVGMSGSGKSSLVLAGVVPVLVRPGSVAGVRLWRRAVLKPCDASGDLFDGLAAALIRDEALPELGADGTTARELGHLLRGSPKAAAALVTLLPPRPRPHPTLEITLGEGHTPPLCALSSSWSRKSLISRADGF